MHPDAPTPRWLARAAALAMILFIAAPPPLRGQEQSLPARADLEQKLGARIPLGLTFTDETGRQVALGSYFGQRPVIMQLGYNHCWLMCDVVTGALVRSLQDIRLTPGTDFNVLFVSIDPTETWQLAARKQADYTRSYGRSRTGAGWHFLTGSQAAITTLADTVGFHYFYDAPSKMFAHPSGLIIATPGGVVSKYFYGVEFDPAALRQALLDARRGTIGGRVEALLLLCYHWNPLSGKYGPVIAAALKVLCLGTVALLAGYILTSLRKDARSRRLAGQSAHLP